MTKKFEVGKTYKMGAYHTATIIKRTEKKATKVTFIVDGDESKNYTREVEVVSRRDGFVRTFNETLRGRINGFGSFEFSARKVVEEVQEVDASEYAVTAEAQDIATQAEIENAAAVVEETNCVWQHYTDEGGLAIHVYDVLKIGKGSITISHTSRSEVTEVSFDSLNLDSGFNISAYYVAINNDGRFSFGCSQNYYTATQYTFDTYGAAKKFADGLVEMLKDRKIIRTVATQDTAIIEENSAVVIGSIDEELDGSQEDDADEESILDTAAITFDVDDEDDDELVDEAEIDSAAVVEEIPQVEVNTISIGTLEATYNQFFQMGCFLEDDTASLQARLEYIQERIGIEREYQEDDTPKLVKTAWENILRYYAYIAYYEDEINRYTVLFHESKKFQEQL